MSMGKVCSNPFKYIEIYPNGDIMPCCGNFCKNYIFGNLYEYPLPELLQSERARTFHNKILCGDYSNCNLDICKSREPTLLEVKDIKKNYFQGENVAFPEVVSIACDLECNVACSICRDSYHRNSLEEEKKLEQLTANFFPYLDNCKTLYLSGGGDPFGSRYARRLIRRVVETYPQIRFQFITNGVLLTRKLYTSLGLEKRTSAIFVSVHAATKATYNQMIRGGNFHHLMRNLEWLAKAHSLGEIPSFIVLFVVTDLNFREMPAFAELAERLGAEVHFTAYRPHGGTTFAQSYAERAVFENEHSTHLEFLSILAHPALDKAHCRLEPRLKRLRDRAITPTVCVQPFYYAEVTQQGAVTPCCPAYCNCYSFGDIEKQPLEKIWRSSEAEAFRKRLLKNDYSLCNLKACASRQNMSPAEIYRTYYTQELIRFPKTIVMSYDRECNVACGICRKELLRNSPEDEMRLERYAKSVLSGLHEAEIFLLSGAGDPFGSRHARRLIKEVIDRNPQIKFELITNGLLCTPGMIRALGMGGHINYVRISIHAATQKTYETIMRYGRYDKLLRNLAWLAEQKKLGNIKGLTFLFVVNSLNYKEMPDFVRLAKKHAATVRFTFYRNQHRETFSEQYAKYAVFQEEHPEFTQLLRVLRDPELGDNCSFDGLLSGLRARALQQAQCTLPPVRTGEEAARAETRHSSRGLAKRLARMGKNLVRQWLDSKEGAGMPIDLQGLNIREYQAHLLSVLNARHSFQGKRVLEIGSDIQLQTAQAMLRYGAEQVWALNPAFAGDLHSPDPRILPTKTLGERSGLPDACADIIFGIALLEHVHDPVSLAQECRRLLKPGGLCFLQGNPLWASYRGHHIYLQQTPSGRPYLFGEASNPFEPWEHLVLDTDEKAQTALHEKGIPEEDIPVVCNQLLRDPHISRLLAADIVAPFYELEGMVVDVQRTSSGLPANAHFASALAVYSEDDLRTDDLRIYLTYDADDAQRKNIIPVGPGAMPAFYLMQGGLRTVSNQSIETLPLDYPHMSPQTVLALLGRDFVGYAEGLSYNAEHGHWKNSALSISFNHDTDCGPQDKIRLTLRLHERADRFRRAMQSGVPALFVFSAYHMKESAEFIQQLLSVLRKWREDRPFTLVVWGDDPSLEHLRDDNLAIVRVPYPFAEVQDWWKPEKMQSPVGQTFLSALMDGTRNAMKS